MLTTGATTRNSILNIYDLAGNIYEWTLEKTPSTSDPCSSRGGRCDFTGSEDPAFARGPGSTTLSEVYVGCRPALW